MYRYFSASVLDEKLYWETKKIENFLASQSLLLPSGTGRFRGRGFFLSVFLLSVNSTDSWSSNDYNSEKTNYVGIITDYCVSGECRELMDGLAAFLGCPFIEEEQ